MVHTHLDSVKSLREHRKIIREKKFLKRIYAGFYKQLKPAGIPKGPIVELGSGAGFIKTAFLQAPPVKKVISKTITSDVIPGPGIDRVFPAEKIPFKDKSVSAFVMLDVFHHIKDPERALRQMQRCLKAGGKIIMIEPYNSLWGGFIYRHLHYEHFDPKAGWKVKGSNRMSDSNTALPWIIFVRDRKILEKRFPNLKILKVKPHTPFLYLLSGGLTKPQLLPTFTYPAVEFFEKLISPLNPLIGMFATIELQKQHG